MPIRHLPSVSIEGHRSSGLGTPDHPMRVATRRAAGLEPDGWTSELRHDVQHYFDELAADWHTRASAARTAVVRDALVRGLDAIGSSGGESSGRGSLAIEVGSGVGTYSPLLAERFSRLLAVDLSMTMLALAPAAPALRVQADGARLPVRDGSAAVVALINAFLFPDEVARVLSASGAVVWVNSSGEQTPIHLSVDDLLARLPGRWDGVASRAGEGIWCVVRRMALR